MKKILVFLSILLLTGCTVNYDLEINNNSINESITGTISKNEFDDITDEYGDHNIYHLLHDKQASLFNNTAFYGQDINDNDGIINFNYKYTYNNNFGEANILNKCFENKVFEENDDLYMIHLYGNFYCQYNDEIEINVRTNLAVLENNADRIDENNYKWILKNDTNRVDISMTVSKNIEAFTPNEESSIFTPYRIITFIIFIILLLVLFFIYKKRNSEK